MPASVRHVQRKTRGIPTAWAALLLAVALGACGDPPAGEGERPAPSPEAAPAVATPVDSEPQRFVVDTVATGLVIPWALAFTPDGRILVTERPGRVRVLAGDSLLPEPWATFDVYREEKSIFPEAGLMGIALAPDYATSRAVYLVGTFWRDDRLREPSLPTRIVRRLEEAVGRRSAPRWENRVYRCRDEGARGTGCEAVIRGLPASFYHAGGAIAFGPDGMLWLSTGDALEPDLTREEGSLAGRILRYTPDGRVPADNPVPGSPVWASGFRNVQAMQWHPATGELFVAEHGPSGMEQEAMRRGDDEIDVVVANGDYGWPHVTGRQPREGTRPPLHLWPVAIAPAGLSIHDGAFEAWRGDALVGGLRGRTLRRVDLERQGDAWVVARETQLLDDRHGRIRAVVTGPDGALYVTTSNRDVRGRAGPHDDLLLRLRPAR